MGGKREIRVTQANGRQGQSAKALERGLDMLDYLLRDAEAPLHAIAEATDTPPSTVHRLLTVLESRGYATSHQGVYRLGVKGLLMTSSRDAIRSVLRELAQDLSETANFAMLVNDEMEFVERAVADHPLSFVVSVGSRVPLHSTAMGKALLTGRPDLIDGLDLRQVTPRTITDAVELRAELDVARHRGFAMDEEEFIDGVFCVAAPVYGKGQLPVGALSVSGPAVRLSRSWAFEVAERIKRSAEHIGDLLR